MLFNVSFAIIRTEVQNKGLSKTILDLCYKIYFQNYLQYLIKLYSILILWDTSVCILKIVYRICKLNIFIWKKICFTCSLCTESNDGEHLEPLRNVFLSTVLVQILQMHTLGLVYLSIYVSIDLPIYWSTSLSLSLSLSFILSRYLSYIVAIGFWSSSRE